uniref:Uncharacterized protein n=1 Tax=Knipowitschia caucasica TaxID=637954 RepID=A0AAV2K906_KNICA
MCRTARGSDIKMDARPEEPLSLLTSAPRPAASFSLKCDDIKAPSRVSRPLPWLRFVALRGCFVELQAEGLSVIFATDDVKKWHLPGSELSACRIVHT